MNDIDFDYSETMISSLSHLKKQVVDIECLLENNLYGFKDIRKLQAFMNLCNLRKRYITPENPNPQIFVETEKLRQELGLSEWLLKSFKADLESKGLIQRARANIWSNGRWHGSRTYIKITEQGMDLFWKIKNGFKKQKKTEPKKQVLKYTDQDMENAKFWFKSLRRYWQGSAGKLKQIGSWEKQKEIRANAARKAREKLEITAEEFMTILKRIVDSSEADFYLSNVLGPNKFNDKWANGTVAETMQQKIEELDKKDEKQSYLILNGAEDIPEDCTEDEEEMWKIMWRVIGHRLIKNFVKKGQEKFDEYYDCLANICTELVECEVRESNIAKLRFKNKDVKRKFDAEQDKYKSAYFYFLLDKYNYTDCLFLSDMILNSWWDFWNMVEPNMSSQTREELTPRTFTINDDMPA